MHTKNASGNIVLLCFILTLIAGALGSVLTLVATNKLQMSLMVESIAQTDTLTDEEVAEISPKPLTAPHDSKLDNTAGEDTTRISELSKALEEATQERTQLANVLAQLTRQLETVENEIANMRLMETADVVPPTLPRAREFSEFSGTGNTGELDGQDRVKALVLAGIDEQSAQSLQARQDQYQLARLELFDRAQREGWDDSEQLSDRLSELNAQRPDLREELGDDAYDRYLFEAGRSNRVIVASIITGSAADIAGLKAGDMLISYAGERIFSTRELQRATRAGVRGESVAVDVSRQGQTLFFDIQRGPMGVTLNQDQQNPS